MTQAEKKAAYEQSSLKQLMEGSGHQICNRCFCCEVVNDDATCWLCGGFDDYGDDPFGNDPCVECGGEGTIKNRHCIGYCDENGEHKTSVLSGS